MLCCETRSCHARRHNDLEGHSNFSSTIYSFSIYLKVKSAKCLCLLPMVWFWSCYFGLGLGLKNFALFTSLPFSALWFRGLPFV